MAYREVWKFPMISTGPAWIKLPVDSTIVLVDRDPATGLIAFWAEVSPTAEKVERCFAVVGTGRRIPDGGRHCGSALQGQYVWHLYEIEAPTDGQ